MTLTDGARRSTVIVSEAKQSPALGSATRPGIASLVARKKWKICSDLRRPKKILSFRAGRPPAGGQLATLKFDYRATDTIGFNLEFPALAHFDSRRGRPPPNLFPETPDGNAPIAERGSPFSTWGFGDVFTRIR